MRGYNVSDKRKNYRVYIRIPVTCEITDPKDKTTRPKTMMSNDISSEGIYLESDEIISLKTELSVAFQLPNSGHSIQAVIKIARLEITKDEDKFGLGAIFIKLADKDREEIKQSVERLNINKLLEIAVKRGASDLHLLADSPPVLRIRGELEILDLPKLHADELIPLIYSTMNKQQVEAFEKDKEADFGIQYDIDNRFRINVHQQRGFIEAAFRLINAKVSSFEELRIPAVVADLTRQKDGLILVAGPTGSGKTTTIAAIVDLINQERKALIITLERPIEYVHKNNKSIIKQREVGVDTNSFSVALKSSLRQDPNIIVVGELDDMETIRTALIAAEAGYLVVASFHAPNTVQSIDRLVSIFPLDNRRQVLGQLANSLKGVVTQLLVPRADKKGRLLATEILIVNEAVRKVIRNDELVQLTTILQTGASYRMHPMVDSLKRYFEQAIIDGETLDWYSKEFK